MATGCGWMPGRTAGQPAHNHFSPNASSPRIHYPECHTLRIPLKYSPAVKPPLSHYGHPIPLERWSLLLRVYTRRGWLPRRWSLRVSVCSSELNVTGVELKRVVQGWRQVHCQPGLHGGKGGHGELHCPDLVQPAGALRPEGTALLSDSLCVCVPRGCSFHRRAFLRHFLLLSSLPFAAHSSCPTPCLMEGFLGYLGDSPRCRAW